MKTKKDTRHRILVFGGRNYSNQVRVFNVLDRLHKRLPNIIIVHGNCSGADMLADHWAKDRGVPTEPHPAKWNVYGCAAGPIRNQQMIDSGLDAGIGFPGGYGTAGMYAMLRAAKIMVHIVKEK